MQLKDTSRKFNFNTKLSTQQFTTIIKVSLTDYPNTDYPNNTSISILISY